MSQQEGPRPLVLDTSVAVKWHLPEEYHELTLDVLVAVREDRVELLAPITIAPELFNALWQQHRRSGMPSERVRSMYNDFIESPISFFEIEQLLPRAAEISLQTGAIIYDALFLALAEDADTVVVTADGRLLKALEGTPYARLARHLAGVSGLLR